MQPLPHYLDYNRHYGYELRYDSTKQELQADLITTAQPWARLSTAMTNQLRVVSADTHGLSATHTPTRRQGSLYFPNIHRQFTLCLGDEPIGQYGVELDGSLTQIYRRPLTVDEVRRMGTFHKTGPYPMKREGMNLEEQRALVRTAETSVFSDFHTHSSGQITPRGLLEVAMRHKPYHYPIDLMREAGINTSYADIPQKHRAMIKRIPFTPKERPGVVYPDEVEGADLHQLSPADLNKLAARMAMPTDRQSTFTEMEHDAYRFRYPLTKDKKLVRETIIKTAQELSAQGIKYAELAYVGLDDPAMLKLVHDTMEEIKADPATKDLTLRFMLGIPRGIPLEKIEEMLEKAKILTQSPYVVGVDFLGYEVNKTERFVSQYEAFATWANENRPGLTLRVHAGENDKNPDNVKDFLKMAVRYPNLHYRIGHGLYGMDKEAIGLAKKLCADHANPRLTVEFNPSSNIALNNLDDLREIPFKAALENGIPFIVSSDSAGTYGTSALQLGLAAYHGGLDQKGFEHLYEHQQYLINFQLLRSLELAQEIPQWSTPEGKQQFLDKLSGELAAVPKAVIPKVAEVTEDEITKKLKHDQVTLVHPGERIPELAGKRSVTIVGASGESWKRIPKGQQREMAIAVDMLIHALGDNTYLVQGRNKRTGISKVMYRSIQEVNETRVAQGRPQLYNVGIYVNPSFDLDQSYRHLTHMVHHSGQLLDLPDAIVGHTFANDGVLVAVGGAAFTRDIVLKADQRGIRDSDAGNNKMMILMSEANGASAEKSVVLHPDYKAIDGRQLVKKLYEQQPDLFPKGFSARQINRLYEDAQKRVSTYGYNIADSKVSDVQLISRTPVPGDKGRTR